MTRFLATLNRNASSPDIFNIANLIQTGGGRVLQAWGASVFIGDASPATQAALSSSPGVAFVTDGMVPDLSLFDIDQTAIEIAGAWLLAETAPFQSAWNSFWNGGMPTGSLLPAEGCGAGVDPGIDQLLTPIGLGGLLGIQGNHQLAPSLAHRNRRAFVGTIGVVLLLVDGPAGSAAAFRPDESVTALASVSQGIRILEGLAPSNAHLVFAVDIRRASINVNPLSLPSPANPSSPTASEYEQIERTWRDPALAQLGAAQSRAGFRDLVQSSRFLFNIDWGFVLVVTKYRAAWPGYAPDYRDVVISYSMQPNIPGLPGICAHEIGHTVGAKDEYGPTCRMLHLSGFNNSPNLNCEVGNQFLSVDCLMKNNAPTVCSWTRGHFGWGDHDFDSVLDPFDPDFPAM